MIINNTAKMFFNFINMICPSCLLRAMIMKAYGANIGNNVRIERVSLANFMGDNLRNLEVGDNVYIGTDTIIDIRGQLVIGNSVKIAPGCTIITHIDFGEENLVSSLYPIREGKVQIGSNTVICSNTTILSGVTIGCHTVIGASTLVNRDVPSKVVAFGVPVKWQKNLDI